MLGALAGLPSIGGLGGGFGGGGLEMLGFSLLSSLTSSLTTQSFLGSPTGIPDFKGFQTPAFNSVPANFGSYFGGSGYASSYGFGQAQQGYGGVGNYGPGFVQSNSVYGPNFLSWHDYAIGNSANPYSLPPYTTAFGTAGAYNVGGVSAAGYNYNACPPGYPAPAYNVPNYGSVPNYGNYYGNYQQMQGYGSVSPFQNLSWNYASQSAFYTPAMPSYTQPMVQHQSPYGYGGPSIGHHYPVAPNYPRPRPRPPHCGCQPPKPPSRPPHECGTVPERKTFGTIPNPIKDYDKAAQTLSSRMTGDPYKIGRLADVTPRPEVNKDSLRFQRQGLYAVMQQDPSLNYNVDTGKFYRTYEDGSTKDVLSMSQVTQIMRQNCPPKQEYNQVGRLLKRLPTDQQLFGNYERCKPQPAPAPEPPKPAPQPAPQPVVQTPRVETPVPATPAPAVFTFGSNPATRNTTNSGTTPIIPVNNSAPGTFAGLIGSRGPAVGAGQNIPGVDTSALNFSSLAQAQAQTQAARQAGNLNDNTLNLEILRLASQAGAIRTVNNNFGGQGAAPFSVTAHRYWDSAKGGYANVSEISISDGLDTDKVYNPLGQHSVQLTKPDAALGGQVKVSVTWDNGQSRVWDYNHNNREVGSSADVFSPLG